MTNGRLIRAWALLADFTAFSTLLHFSDVHPSITGCLILGAGWVKARLILLDYLELRGVPNWSAGLQTGLAALVALLTVLFLAA